MNKHHQEILEEIKKQAGKGTKHSGKDSYLGSGHIYYSLSNPVRREIIRGWVKTHKDITLREFTNLLNSLYKGKSYEEKTTAGMLLSYYPKSRKQLDPHLVNGWLDQLVGWAEVDTTCQSNFTADELLKDWSIWKSLIEKLSKDKNINKRRVSLVLLTGVVSRSDDKRLSDLAFQLIDRLRSEKDVLITKAVSWLLRDLTKLHCQQVEKYLKENEDTLPKIAIRETRQKLLTGRKSKN